jgi:hypothetical protein
VEQDGPKTKVPIGVGEDGFMKAASASILSAAEIAAFAGDPRESVRNVLPNEAILALRGLLIGLVLLALAAATGIAIATLTVGYPIGRMG